MLYHGVGPASDFANADDASYGVDVDEFARQMTLMKHAGYETIDLQTFIDFVQRKPVDLPPRPLLLTFDDGRLDSGRGADDILEKLGLTAVMFVDVGTVDDGQNPEYLTWTQLGAMQDSDRWNLQSRTPAMATGSSKSTACRRLTTRSRTTGESFADWQKRVRSDIEWGEQTLADHIPGYEAARVRSPLRQLRP